MRGELVDEDTVSLFHGEIMKRGRLKQSIDKSIDEGKERVEEIGAWSDATRSFGLFYHHRNSAVFSFPVRSFPTNSFLITEIRSEMNISIFLFIGTFASMFVCAAKPASKNTAPVSKPSRIGYRKEIGRKCVSLRLRINRLKKKQQVPFEEYPKSIFDFV